MTKNDAIEYAIISIRVRIKDWQQQNSLTPNWAKEKIDIGNQAIAILESMKEAQDAPPDEAR